MSMQNLFVAKLPRNVTDTDLYQIFAAYKPTGAKVMLDATSGKSKGFGFVLFDSEESGSKAYKALNRKSTRACGHNFTLVIYPSNHDGKAASEASNALYIRNIPMTVSQERVEHFLRTFGNLTYCAMREDHYGSPVWVVYAEYETVDSAKHALQKLHGNNSYFHGSAPILAKYQDSDEAKRERRRRREGQPGGSSHQPPSSGCVFPPPRTPTTANVSHSHGDSSSHGGASVNTAHNNHGTSNSINGGADVSVGTVSSGSPGASQDDFIKRVNTLSGDVGGMTASSVGSAPRTGTVPNALAPAFQAAMSSLGLQAPHVQHHHHSTHHTLLEQRQPSFPLLQSPVAPAPALSLPQHAIHGTPGYCYTLSERGPQIFIPASSFGQPPSSVDIQMQSQVHSAPQPMPIVTPTSGFPSLLTPQSSNTVVLLEGKQQFVLSKDAMNMPGASTLSTGSPVSLFGSPTPQTSAPVPPQCVTMQGDTTGSPTSTGNPFGVFVGSSQDASAAPLLTVGRSSSPGMLLFPFTTPPTLNPNGSV